jgi:hypothetical protein
MPSIPLDLVAVDFDHLVQTEEDRRHPLVRQPLKGPSISAVDILQRIAEASLPMLVPDWGEDQGCSVGGNCQRRIGVYVQQVQNAPIDYQSQTVAMLCQALDHLISPPQGSPM